MDAFRQLRDGMIEFNHAQIEEALLSTIRKTIQDYGKKHVYINFVCSDEGLIAEIKEEDIE